MAENKYRSIDEITHNGRPLREILEAHRKWGESDGEKGTKADLHAADLREGDLSEGNLSGADLSGADLSDADLSKVDLSDADLSEANLSHCRLNDAALIGAGLQRANLAGSDLGGADLSLANLSEADLHGADLNGADLSGADLVAAELHDANLNGADLSGADLSGADLSDAYLIGATLRETNLSGAILEHANLKKARFWLTKMLDCDLSGVMGLGEARHGGPSSIGIDTIFKSQGKIPEIFLKGAGVPDIFITYTKSLVANPIEFYSCFISHSSADKDFCERLYTDLQAKGVRCWYFPEDATWGRSVWGEIDQSIRVYDKLVVVCSEHSLNSGPVIREIERALQREDNEKREVLFPIRIDDFLFDKWDHPRKADVIAKVVGDFRTWKDHDQYTKNFDKLLKALNRKRADLP